MRERELEIREREDEIRDMMEVVSKRNEEMRELREGSLRMLHAEQVRKVKRFGMVM